MPLTENELRDLLHQRSAGAPATPDRVGAVRTRVAKQRRRELAAVSGALALVVVAGAVWAVPRNSAKPVDPASPSPSASPSITGSVSGTVTTVASIAGVATTVTGPQSVTGDAAFDVVLTAKNDGAKPWTGTLGAGTVYEVPVPGLFEGGLVMSVDPSVPAGTNELGMTMAEPNRQFHGVTTSDAVTLAAGEERSWTFRMQRNPGSAVTGKVWGWTAYAAREGDTSEDAVDVAGASLLSLTPAASNRACDSVTIGDWSRGEPNAWSLDLAWTAVVGADGKVSWEEHSGLGDQGSYVSSTQIGTVASSTVIKALGDLGAATPSAFGAEQPDRPTTLAPGRYVAYSGTQTVPITFAGTCGPSGEPISGVWTAYNDRETGLVDCASPGSASALAAKAAAICPKG